MTTLTPFEWRLRAVLLAAARSADPADPVGGCLTYRQLGDRVDPEGELADARPQTRPRFLGMDPALGHVSRYEEEHGRPLLSALVVVDPSVHPGQGIGKLATHLDEEVDDPQAYWRQAVEAVVAYWTSDDETRHLDAALEQVREEIAVLTRIVRRRLPPPPER